MSSQHETRDLVGLFLRSIGCVVCLFLCGCAYFNTFYNAKQFYKQAEAARTQPGAGTLAGSNEYKACIDKCLLLMRFHPNSKYVDDSLFLIGMSHLHRAEYVQSQASFKDLLDRFPESEYTERAYFHMGLAALKMDDPGAASRIFSTLQDLYPDSEYNTEAVFRTAEARLDSRDYDAAREELRKFIRNHPESPLVIDAKVQVARTFYDEEFYDDARQAYEEILKEKLSQELLYEAELHIALAQREEAEKTLSDPALYDSTDLPTGLMLQPGKVEALGPNDGEPELSTTPDSSLVQGNAAGDAGAGSSNAADSLGSSGETTAAPAENPSETPAQPQVALPESLRVLRQQAEDRLAQSAEQLQALQKTATKLGREFEHRIEVAVTRALLGEPEEAIDELDQIARTQPRSKISASALYEMAEIQRRIGDFSKARESYDSASRQTRDAPVNASARAKSSAIQARAAALEKLREAPDVVRRYRVAHGFELPSEPDPEQPSGTQDSLNALVQLETRYDDLAGQMLRIAEIDLFELDQPRLALFEFKRVLKEFPDSSQSARAAFAIGWIYENVLNDPVAAESAYRTVVRDYPDTHQAREALALLARLGEGAEGSPEVTEPSSRP